MKSLSDVKDIWKHLNLIVSVDETDPKRIEEVANEVMKLSLPVSSRALKNMTTEIHKHVARLTNVEDILAQTAEKTRTAERLLQQAQAAKSVNTHTHWVFMFYRDFPYTVGIMIFILYILSSYPKLTPKPNCQSSYARIVSKPGTIIHCWFPQSFSDAVLIGFFHL